MKEEINKWTCPVCGFTTLNKSKKKEHFQKTKNDPYHFTLQREENIYRGTLLSKVQNEWNQQFSSDYEAYLWKRRLNC